MKLPVKRRSWLSEPAFLLFVALTLAKLLVFLVLVHQGRVAPFVGDNSRDHNLPTAERLLNEGRFNGPDSRTNSSVGPAYPAVIAVFMLVAQSRYLVAVACFQMVADLATAMVLWWMGASYASSKVGVLAGVVWLLYPPEIVMSTWITSETLFTALLMCSVAAFLWSLERCYATRFVLAGILLGATTLCRSTTILLPGVLVLALLWRRPYRRAACFAGGFLVVVCPWAIRNMVVLRDPIPVSVGFGGAFLQGSDERVFTIRGKQTYYPQMYADAAKDGIVKPNTDHESQIDHWLFQIGLHNYRQRLKERPLSIIPFQLKKFLRLWYSTESGGLNGQLILGLCSLPIVLPGLWHLSRGSEVRSQLSIASGIVVLYFILLSSAIDPINRYVLPIYPILSLAGCDWLLRQFPHLDSLGGRKCESPMTRQEYESAVITPSSGQSPRNTAVRLKVEQNQLVAGIE
jgi:4-amino-4-deoxy-L-arabinose transferase-like glycosyltransferase